VKFAYDLKTIIVWTQFTVLKYTYCRD